MKAAWLATTDQLPPVSPRATRFFVSSLLSKRPKGGEAVTRGKINGGWPFPWTHIITFQAYVHAAIQPNLIGSQILIYKENERGYH
jgi:hypothetical protein